jgi:EAL domain-containing protein (putative c-di-GMP-specific phosphodiesterase class I)
MGHSLCLRVLAEGVETKDQSDFLEHHECDEYQGFLFHRPMPADELTTLLLSRAVRSGTG